MSACVYCHEPRAAHGPFARCVPKGDQFLSSEDLDGLLRQEARGYLSEFADGEMQGIIQMEKLEVPLRAKVCRVWLKLNDYDDHDWDEMPDAEVCQKAYNILEKRAFPE